MANLKDFDSFEMDDLQTMLLYLGVNLAVHYMKSFSDPVEKGKLLATELSSGDAGLVRLASAGVVNFILCESIRNDPQSGAGISNTDFMGLDFDALKAKADALFPKYTQLLREHNRQHSDRMEVDSFLRDLENEINEPKQDTPPSN